MGKLVVDDILPEKIPGEAWIKPKHGDVISTSFNISELRGGETMKAILIKGLELPDEKGFLDVRIQGNGKALMVCGMGNCITYDAEEIEINEEET